MDVPVNSPVKPASGGGAARVLLHASLLAVFGTVGGVLLVWPQWVGLEGSRTALRIQQEREEELEQRFEAMRAMSDRLRAWNSAERRVFLSEELQAYPERVRALAAREGAMTLGVRVGGPASSRWQSLAGAAGMWADGGETSAGEIRPVAVKMSFSGPFDAVYRTVAALGQEERLVLPDRWQMARRGPASREVRADVTATVFLIAEAEESRPAPVVSGPMAAAALLETQ